LTSWYILQYSVLFLIFNFLLQINFNILAWVWKVSERAKIVWYAVIINIITNIIFIYFMWVYWAAIATWIGWIFIWYKSEAILKNEYKININWNIIFKNIVILWSFSILVLWFFWNFKLFILSFSQLQWFFVMLGISIIYFCIFFVINYSTFKKFILEIKKIRHAK
jgi:O-antigen/teichoic acid export membrane protein